MEKILYHYKAKVINV